MRVEGRLMRAVEADNPQGCVLPGRVDTCVDECAQSSAREARKAASLDKLPLHRDKRHKHLARLIHVPALTILADYITGIERL
jgi:hypothetical protein